MTTSNTLGCPKCGSRNTIVISKRKLADYTRDSSMLAQPTGMVDPRVIVAVIAALSAIVVAVFGWLNEREKKDTDVVLCKDCGCWADV